MGTLIDNFMTGPFTPVPDLRSGKHDNTQTGSMLGGKRRTALAVGPNSRNQPIHFEVGNEHGLNVTVPVSVAVNLELFYGVDAQPGGESSVPVLLDLSNSSGLRLQVVYTSVLRFTFSLELRSNTISRSSFTGSLGGQAGDPRTVDLLFAGGSGIRFGTSGEKAADLRSIRFVHFVSTINDSFSIKQFEAI